MTIAVDFDGVIHAYSKGWHDGTIYDPPMPGALDGLRQLMKQHAVFVLTTRDISQVGSWLLERDFSVRLGHDGPFWNERGRLLVTNRKLAATAYLDDRAVRFTTWPKALTDLTTPAPAKPPLPTDSFGDWERVPVDEQDGGDFAQILRIGAFAADHWTFSPEGPYQQRQTQAEATRAQIREALLHLLELGLLDIDTDRLHAAAGYPMQRTTRP
ncbi:hypothetical protein [Streptomyces sp. STCH 565 A]|uniref:hypothetical protein n=1 Tax=Streptomyces sp. STCH 565 A TaxID=2950532 RepID=UPI002074DF02|nr:hypothetical protein [Streptomyces sp. STCH 565 A]MCM8548931.1 hypothetical protein [Streptomyces sp. STCH 565 A]